MPFALHQVTKVSDLINHTDLRWKAELVKKLYNPFHSEKIMSFPLTKTTNTLFKQTCIPSKEGLPVVTPGF